MGSLIFRHRRRVGARAALASVSYDLRCGHPKGRPYRRGDSLRHTRRVGACPHRQRSVPNGEGLNEAVRQTGPVGGDVSPPYEKMFDSRRAASHGRRLCDCYFMSDFT